MVKTSIIGLIIVIIVVGIGVGVYVSTRPTEVKTIIVSTQGGWACHEPVWDRTSQFTENTGIEVTYEFLGTPMWATKPLAAFSMGTKTIDVCTASGSFVASFYPHCLPLNEYAERDFGSVDAFLELAYPTVREIMVFDGDLLFIPHHYNAEYLAYRSDLFNDPSERAAFKEQFGYEMKRPETHQEIIDIARFFTRPEDDMLGITWWGTLPYEFLSACISETGHFPIDDEGNVLIDVGGPAREGYLGVAQLFWDLNFTYHTCPAAIAAEDPSAAAERFAAGRVFMVDGWLGDYWPTLLNSPETTAKFGPCGSWPWPVGEGGWLSVWWYAVDKNTDEPDESWEYIKWAISEPINLAQSIESGQGSPYISTNEEAVARGVVAGGLSEAFESPTMVLPPLHPAWTEIEASSTEYISAFYEGAYASPEEFLNAYVDMCKEVLASL